ARHQAAGHPGSLTMEGGALFIKSTVKQEVDFYTEVAKLDGETESAIGSSLLDWLPAFMGTLTEGNLRDANQVVDPSKEYIVLQNLYHGYTYPSILDIKLGSKLTDDSKTEADKIARLQKVSDETTSGSLNFRICGMKLYNGDDHDPSPFFKGMEQTVHPSMDGSDKYLEFDKIFGRSLTKENVIVGLDLYFSHYFAKKTNGDAIILKLLDTFLKRLQLLYNCLLDYEVRIFSGSLLFMYENDLTRWDLDEYDSLDPLIRDPVIPIDDDSDDEDEDTSFQAPLSGLNLIDMAHAKFVKGKGYDENVVQGIENLIEIFEKLIEKRT
ncbi:SAICAR synthase-like protein, partial [Suhomyces tanzawaensis NRRL Y-17324]